jgi:hypothetical protein
MNARRSSIVAAVLLASAVLPTLATTASATSADAASTAVLAHTTSSELLALHAAKWASNVRVTYAKNSWTFVSNGIPASRFLAADYAVPSNPFDVSAAGASIVSVGSVLRDQNYDYTFSLTPTYSAKVTKAPMGPIGVMINGAALYNPYEANASTIATADNFVTTKNGVTASFIDSCDGHPGGPGEYHYHGLPACLVAYATGTTQHVGAVKVLKGSTTAAVSEVTAASKIPVLLGVAFDGFGIYDNIAMNSKVVPVSALDACNGITSPVPGYPHGIYHYVLENVKRARSSVDCFHGVVSSAYTKALEHDLTGSNTNSGGATLISDSRARPADATRDAYLLDLLKADERAQC